MPGIRMTVHHVEQAILCMWLEAAATERVIARPANGRNDRCGSAVLTGEMPHIIKAWPRLLLTADSHVFASNIAGRFQYAFRKSNTPA